jgi:hypothetical protein
MRFDLKTSMILQEKGVEVSTIMKSICLRYKGDFLGMIFKREDALVIKVSPERVNELIADGKGKPFDFTGKRFKAWVLIPADYEAEYDACLAEALAYARRSGG